VKNGWLAALAVGSIVAVASGVHELLVLAVAVAIGSVTALARTDRSSGRLSVVALPAVPDAAATKRLLSALGIGGLVPGTVSLWPLFAIFLKIGSVLFGSGYVLLAFLRADFVERLGWLTERQLLDAVAVGQVTPGPVFTTATFIGYVLAGVPGAVVATVGIFLPAFLFVAISGPLIPRLRRSPIAGAALDAVNAASLGLMAIVTWQLGRDSITSLPLVMLALAAAGLLATGRVNAAWLIVGGAIAGIALGMRSS
jgi:chromate transporter